MCARLKTATKLLENDQRHFLLMVCFFFFSPSVENERAPPNQQHGREFRFDLSRIPDGEVITGAEFRIYKNVMQERFDNETFRVSLYQIVQESANRYVRAIYFSKLFHGSGLSFAGLLQSFFLLVLASTPAVFTQTLVSITETWRFPPGQVYTILPRTGRPPPPPHPPGSWTAERSQMFEHQLYSFFSFLFPSITLAVFSLAAPLPAHASAPMSSIRPHL